MITIPPNVSFIPSSHREPSIVKKAVSFAKSAARHVAAGLPSVTPAEQDRRMALCLECDQYNAVKQSCRKCGCRMKLKTSWALEKCPLGLW